MATPPRNPIRTRDELFLALDLYRTNPASPPGKGTVAVAALSNLLNELHRLTGSAASPTFRNTNDVYMKMMKLRALDEAFTVQGTVGITAGCARDKEVWDAYTGRWDALAIDAAAIRNVVEDADEDAVAALPSVERCEGEEGGVIMRLHKRYERDARSIAEKRKAATAGGGRYCQKYAVSDLLLHVWALMSDI